MIRVYSTLAVSAVAFVGLAFAAPTLATTLYQQASSGQACNTSCWTSSIGISDNYGFATFDNFTLAQTSTVTSVSWDGFYYDYVNPSNNPVGPDTLSWSLNFFGDTGGLPDLGHTVGVEGVDPMNVTMTVVAASNFAGNPVTLLHFEATLATPISFAGGTQYWFTPVSVSQVFNPFFSWSPAAVDVDGSSAQYWTQDQSIAARPNDRAFSLTGTVPEPASWAMLLAGFGLVGGAMRRRTTPRTVAA